MRILSADGRSIPDATADILAAENPTIAALTSLTPADACALAAARNLRFAVQCWDAPESGKAILWKPAVELQGLYRLEFAPDRGLDRGTGQRGLLRVTLLWDGRPLHVLCTALAHESPDADWQLVQVVRELSSAVGAKLLTIDPGAAQLPALPDLVDASATARWRSIDFPRTYDLAGAAHAAFGVRPSPSGAAPEPDVAPGGTVSLYCSPDFSVVRVRQRAGAVGSGRDGGPLVVDLVPAANNGDGNPRRAAARSRGRLQSESTGKHPA